MYCHLCFLFFYFAAEPKSVNQYIDGTNYDDIDQVWKSAPAAVKAWAEELKEQKAGIKSLPYRLFLHGIPGTGKTSLAQGILRQNPDWRLIKISAGDLISKNRGEAAKKFQTMVERINLNKKFFVIVDEVQVVMERHAEKSTDTSETTEVIRDFLDKHEKNKNCMIVLIGNDVTDMKESMQNRIFRSMVEIPAPSVSELHGMFHYHAGKEGLAHENVTGEILEQIYREGNIKVGRDIQSFAAVLKEYIRDNGYRDSLKKYQLTKSYLLDVVENVYKKKMIAAGIGKKKLSDREFQQQLHDDALIHQKQLHEDSLKRQKQLHDDGKKHQTRLAIGSGVGGGLCVGAGIFASGTTAGGAAATGTAGAGVVAATGTAGTAAVATGTSTAGGVSAIFASKGVAMAGGTLLSKSGVGMVAAGTAGKSVLAGGAVVATTSSSAAGGAAAGTVASTGLAAKLVLLTKGAGAVLAANPVIAGGALAVVVIGGVTYYVCSDSKEEASSATVLNTN